MPTGLHVAIAGATGAVGREILSILEEREFPIRQLTLLASERSEGERLEFRGDGIRVERLRAGSVGGVELALFSAGSPRSLEFVPEAVRAGAVVVDNSSAFRMQADVPLVVPEVNPREVARHRGIIANPNCSTIQLVVPLKPLHDAARIRRLVVSTYQSVSGAGHKGVEELAEQTKAIFNFQPVEPRVMAQQIAFNCLPHIDLFQEDGDTLEETKIICESRKVLGEPDLRITATAVRVPVFHCHSESINVEFERPLTAAAAREILERAPGVEVQDDVESNYYPMAIDAAGKDPVFVGRIRQDPSVENGLNLWTVADNLRKGAALNAVQVAELLLEGGSLG
ncbi:MAG: aspartate-semialdehyde dehydrogenase [Nitrospinota bacterium]